MNTNMDVKTSINNYYPINMECFNPIYISKMKLINIQIKKIKVEK